MKLRSMVEVYKTSPEWRRVKPATRRIYEQGLRTLERFMDLDMNKITRPMLLDFKDELYDRPGKLKPAMNILRTILQYAYDRGKVDFNHANGFRGMPPSKPHERWTLEEVEKVKAAAPQYVKDIIDMALYTGQRRSDVIRMNWDNYDGRYIHVIQQKTTKALAIPVHPDLKKVLDRLKGENRRAPYTKSPRILTNTYGNELSQAAATTAVRTACRKAGVDKVLHGLRKTTASVLAEIGCTPHEIAAITGHSVEEMINYTKQASQKMLAEKAMEKWSSV